MRRDSATCDINAIQELNNLIKRLTLTESERENFKKSPFYIEKWDYSPDNLANMKLSELSVRFGIPYARLYYRVMVRGWSIEKAIKTPCFDYRRREKIYGNT